jgi:hypothetical protein
MVDVAQVTTTAQAITNTVNTINTMIPVYASLIVGVLNAIGLIYHHLTRPTQSSVQSPDTQAQVTDPASNTPQGVKQ